MKLQYLKRDSSEQHFRGERTLWEFLKNKLEHLIKLQHYIPIKNQKAKKLLLSLIRFVIVWKNCDSLVIFVWMGSFCCSIVNHVRSGHHSKLQLKSSSSCCRWNSSSAAALLVLKLAVWVVRVTDQTIFPADFIMPCLSVHLPLLCALFDLLSLPGQSLLISVRPWLTLLAAAAAAAAYNDADEDGSTQDSHGNDEGLKVQPAHPPAGLGQLAHWGWRQQPAHWVFWAAVVGEAPQTLGMRNASVTTVIGRAGRFRRRCLAFPLANEASAQHKNTKEHRSAQCLSLGKNGRHR